MPGYVPPARPTMLEGDYSDWTIYDSFEDAEITCFEWRNMAIFDLDETEAFLLADNKAKKYTIATKTLGASVFNPYIEAGFPMGMSPIRSAYGTYVVMIDNAKGTIYITKKGALLKTLTYTALGLLDANIMSVNISPKGKYVAVAGFDPTSGNPKWVVLAGS